MTAPRPRIPRCHQCGRIKTTTPYRHRTLPAILERAPRRQSHWLRPDGTPLCGRDVPGMRTEAL